MAPMDPQQLLKALDPLLGPTGAILGTTEAVRVASLMKDANKIVSKCIYINILKLTTPQNVIEKLLSQGGWDILNDWLQEWKDEENYPLLVEVLKVYQAMPVTVEILKKNNAAKTIKQLCKSENDNVKTLAGNIFDEWMKKVKGNNNNSISDESKLKKKKKDKEKDKVKEKEKDKESGKDDKKTDKDRKSDSKSDKSKSKDQHHYSSSREKRSDSSDKSKDKKVEQDMDTSSNDSAATSVSDDTPTVRKGNGLKLHIKLGSEKERTQTISDNNDSVKKRASTVKRPPSKFRSTGLEEETVPTKASKPSSNESTKLLPKRTAVSDDKPDLTIKRPRLNMPPPLSVPSTTITMTTMVTTPTSVSPTSPGEMHGKIKIIPPRPRSNHEIHESSGFMDSITTTTRTYGAFKKKKKAALMATSPNGSNKAAPIPPSSPISPTSAMARSLPSVPSFYKDTQQEFEPSPEMEIKKEIKQERSPSPVEEQGMTSTNIKTEIKPEIKTEPEEVAEVQNAEKERSISPDSKDILLATVKESKGLLTTGATKVKKKKKSVRWKDDKDLKQFFFFELDEDERENVNRPKDFKQAMKDDMLFDRRAMETVRRQIKDSMVEQIIWYRPKLLAGVKPFDYGKDSTEKSIQKVREQGVLQALFFNKTMLPDGPQEPEFEHQEPTESKLIPLEDVSGGEEFLYKHEEHPEAILNQPKTVIDPQQQQPMHHVHQQHHQQQQQQQQQQQPPPMLPPSLSLPPGLNLPPDLMNLLTQIQSGQQDPNDPVMAHVQQILNNLMCGGSEQSYEQLQQIQQIMNSQLGMPPDAMMQGPPPLGMPPMGMPPQGPPLGPRTALLGTAPPGFLPQRHMGPPPNRFGPGPPPGNWGQNMGDGPPNMGHRPQGHQGGFGGGGQGPRGPGPNRGRGGIIRGGRLRRVLCRHFASGSCRLGAECTFLHPGINGPPLENQSQDTNG